MNGHLDSDTLATIGDALRWQLPDALRHLDDCEECRAELEEMRLVRMSFLEEEAIDPGVLSRISSAIGAEARAETRRRERRAAVVRVIEPFVAGVAAVMVLGSSDIRIDSVAAALVVFMLGATLMVVGRMLARSVPALRLT